MRLDQIDNPKLRERILKQMREEDEQRNKIHRANGQPQPERNVEYSPNEVSAAQTQSSTRRLVRITRIGKRKLDKDNLYGGCKFIVDALRYAKLIPQDDPDAIELKIDQEECEPGGVERTEVEISSIN